MNRADVVAIVAIVVATLAVAAAVLVRGRRRRADLSDVLAGRIAARPVPVADIYAAALDAYFATAAAILQPDEEYVTDADLAVFRADYDTYRTSGRLPGECAQ